MEKIKDLNIGDLAVLMYKNKLVGDISEVTGFVYKIKHGKIGLSNYHPETAPPWNTNYSNYSIDRILSYEILRKPDKDKKYSPI